MSHVYRTLLVAATLSGVNALTRGCRPAAAPRPGRVREDRDM
ncbi:hypothetical protein [Streptomyces lavendofoliae]